MWSRLLYGSAGFLIEGLLRVGPARGPILYLIRSTFRYVTDHAEANEHVIAVNEGSAVGLAAGYHLATGKLPIV